MSTVFEVPCPECDRQMTLADSGDWECAPCHRQYRARMGHLFALADLAASRTATTDRPATVATS
jgi:hypothetical protein